jgi:hypothetical protein
MRILLGVVVAVALAGCVEVRSSIRPSDVEAWRGASRVELQSHPLFSTLPRQVETLADGEELWTYSSCPATGYPVTCRPDSTGTTICNGGASGETCCQNRFFVKGAAVESYRPVGSCFTDCSVRPGGRCLPAPPAVAAPL